MEYSHEMILCIVNSGFSDAVMDTARELGARGGTVIHARGTAAKDAEKMFGITIQPEKEIVMILVSSEILNCETREPFAELLTDVETERNENDSLRVEEVVLLKICNCEVYEPVFYLRT